MKKGIYLLLSVFFIILFSSCSKQPAENKVFSYMPEHPKPGEEITVYYNSDSTNLSSAENITMTAYLYSKDLDETKGIQLNSSGKGAWSGSFITSDSTKGALLKFENDNNDLDNNDKKGYVIQLYSNDDEILAGSYAGLAAAYNSWGSYYLELDRDPDLAYELFEKEFKRNPEIKNDYLESYLTVLVMKFPGQTDSILNKELTKLEAENDKSENDLAILTKGYQQIGGGSKAQQYKNILEQKYPRNEYLQSVDYRIFYLEQDINKKLQLAEEFQKKYPNSEYTSNVYALLVNYYRDNKDYEKAKEFLKINFDKIGPYRFYSVVDKILENTGNLKTALQIAKMGADKARTELNNPSEKRPNYYSDADWKEDRQYLLGLNLYGYGNVLFKMNKKDEALPKLEEAVQLTQNEEVELNELYVKALLENKNYDKALAEAENFIKKGKSTNEMTGLLKTAYIKVNGSDNGFDKYSEKFEALAKEKMISKLKEEMINEPAPGFTLTDLEGNKISLSDLKGKTVIIDFWATWCGPCLSSFPGMQKAVEKYADNNNVKFLFVNSWERVDNKKDNAQKFIDKTNYPFHILLDTENEVIAKYKVSGIPTKFIVDKNGSIRFKHVGFSGNTDQMVDEISAMISMVN